MNTDINLNTSFTFAPKVLIVQLQAGLLTIPPFDLPSHQPRRTVAMKYQKF